MQLQSGPGSLDVGRGLLRLEHGGERGERGVSAAFITAAASPKIVAKEMKESATRQRSRWIRQTSVALKETKTTARARGRVRY